jgi:hypothetical protein
MTALEDAPYHKKINLQFSLKLEHLSSRTLSKYVKNKIYKNVMFLMFCIAVILISVKKDGTRTKGDLNNFA